MTISKNITCLPMGSKISTPKGKVNIENIVRGDIVYSCASGNGDSLYFKITDKIENDIVVRATVNRIYTGLIIVLLANGNALEITGNHEVYVNNKGWIRSGYLEGGDELIQFDLRGNSLSVAKVARVFMEKGDIVVYDLDTAKYHNYFADNILVHCML